MRDLQKDLEVCKNVISGSWYVDGDGATVFTEINDMPVCDCYNLGTANFIAAAREGWPEAINRAIKAEYIVEGLKAAGAALMEANNISIEEDIKAQNSLKATIKDLQAEVERLRKQLKETFVACSNSNCNHLNYEISLCRLERISIDENGNCDSELPIYTE